MPVIYQHRIYRSDLQRNPDAVYLFGDNEAREGYGGQAAEMRDEPNAYGIATLRSPGEFWSDDDFDRQAGVIGRDVDRVVKAWAPGKVLVIPSDGIGTGLSQLDTRAPTTFSILQLLLKTLTVLYNHR